MNAGVAESEYPLAVEGRSQSAVHMPARVMSTSMFPGDET